LLLASSGVLQSHSRTRTLGDQPLLLDFSDRRAAQKAKFGGELFPAQFAAEPGGTAFLEFFQLDRLTQEPKGIIAIDLEAWA
jgi:hypothetical protein